MRKLIPRIKGILYYVIGFGIVAFEIAGILLAIAIMCCLLSSLFRHTCDITKECAEQKEHKQYIEQCTPIDYNGTTYYFGEKDKYYIKSYLMSKVNNNFKLSVKLKSKKKKQLVISEDKIIQIKVNTKTDKSYIYKGNTDKGKSAVYIVVLSQDEKDKFINDYEEIIGSKLEISTED